MRRGRLHLLALIACALVPVWAWAQLPTRTYLLQNAATVNGNGLVAHATGYTVAAVQVALPGATPTFTINFESSINDTNYTATLCQPIGSLTPAATTTAIGMWRCNVAGSAWFRARLSGYSGSGGVTVLSTLIGDTAVIGVAENQPIGSQSVNQSGTWTVQAGHQGGAWNIDKVSHVTSVMAHVIGTITAEGRGTAGSPAGGIVTVQGAASGTTIASSANQSGVWTVQGSHQGGAWNIDKISHITSVMAHIISTITIEGRGTAGSESGGIVTVQGTSSGTAMPVRPGPQAWNVAHVTSATHVVGSVSGAFTCHSKAGIAQSASGIIAHGSAQFIELCAVLLVNGPTAQSVSLVEGTGALCGTGTVPLLGGATATMQLGVRDSIAMTSGTPWMRTTAADNNICLIQDGTTIVSGAITYRGVP